MADVYGIEEEGRLPYAKLYARLKEEAESKHGDDWVTTISLGSVRNLIKAMERLADLEQHVIKSVMCDKDGKLEEGTAITVDTCPDCFYIRLIKPEEEAPR